MPSDQDALVERLADLFLEMGEYEVDAALRSVGGRTTPAGWRDFKEATKRLSVAGLLRNLASDRLAALANAYAEEMRHQAPTIAPEGPGDRGPSVFDDPPSPASRTPMAVGDMLAEMDRQSIVRPDQERQGARGDRYIPPDAPIFIVHGRDHDALYRAARVMERTTRRDVTVLHEQVNGGRTLLEKFEGHAAEAAYAVVLLTGDDVGGIPDDLGEKILRPHRRARQNVIFELGFFFGALGRGRVAVLIEDGVEKPSDIDGLVYIGLDAGGSWKTTLCREVEAAGIAVDYSRMP